MRFLVDHPTKVQYIHNINAAKMLIGQRPLTTEEFEQLMSRTLVKLDSILSNFQMEVKRLIHNRQMQSKQKAFSKEQGKC